MGEQQDTNLKTDLLDLFAYLAAMQAEEKRNTPTGPNTSIATPLFLSLQKRCETLWDTIHHKLEGRTGLQPNIENIYEDGRLVGYDIRMVFRPGDPPPP